jgi:hypothetical protein
LFISYGVASNFRQIDCAYFTRSKWFWSNTRIKHRDRCRAERIQETTMKKTILAIAAAATVATSGIVAPTGAEARGRGGAVAAGIIGGLAAGAIIGGALSSRPAYAAPRAYYYEPEPVYVAPRPRCFWTRGEPMWDGYGWVRPRVRVCD